MVLADEFLAQTAHVACNVVPGDFGGIRLYAVSIVWGRTGDVTFATDNGLANLYCSRGVVGTFPGCVTDFNGDTSLDELGAREGALRVR